MTNHTLKRNVLIILIISTILAIILSVLVYFYPVMTIDVTVTKFIQAGGDTPFKKALALYFFQRVSYLGIPAVSIWMVLITAFIYWTIKYYRESIYFLSTLLAPVFYIIIKDIIHRPRPTNNYAQIIDQQLSPSFPSGHVMFYTVFFGLLFATMFYTKKIPKLMRIIVVILSIVLILSVSVSRIYLGAHWVTDAVGGYLFGFIFLSIILYFYLKKLTIDRDTSPHTKE